MQVRIHTIEEKLQKILESTRSPHCPASAAAASIEATSTPEIPGRQKWTFDPLQPSLYYGPSDGDLFLPPLEDMVPIIDHYFNTLNRTFPLFNQANFMGLVSGWYGKTPKRSNVIWANILVVIAMGLQSLASGDQSLCGSYGTDRDFMSYCMRNAQSVMSELVSRDEDLLGIQVILALALVFRSSCDLRPACTLLASAVALSHRMHLHSNDSTQYYCVRETQQRSRVFWVLYMLDKGLCIRTKTPHMLLDSEIGLSLPPAVPADNTGAIRTTDERHEMNIFHLRLDLAFIEGKIYHLLYSCRSSKIQSSEQEKRVANLQAMLDSWYARVPVAFRIQEVTSTVSDTDLEQITNLYHTYLLCYFSIHGIYSHKAEWIQKASSLTQVALQEFVVATQGRGFAPCRHISHAPLGTGWQRCVDISRESMALFQATKLTESVIWQSSCVHFSALIVLLANILVSPAHPSAPADFVLATESIDLLRQVLDVTQSSSYEPLSRAVKDLYKDASTAIGDIETNQVNATDVLGSLRGLQGGMDLNAPEMEYFGLEDQFVGGSTQLDGILDPFLVDFSWPSSTL